MWYSRFPLFCTAAPQLAPTISNRAPDQIDVQLISPTDFVLIVTGQGDPIPTLTWLKDNVPINAPADARITVTLITNIDVFRITSILNFGQTVPSDSGRYTCVVSNEAGNVTTFFDVTVNGRLKQCFSLSMMIYQ